MSDLPSASRDSSERTSSSQQAVGTAAKGSKASPAESWRPTTRWAVKVLLEVVLIGGGVFLGLLGEQWRENAKNREEAQLSLQRIRAEILDNRNAVAAVADYHVRTMKDLRAYLNAPAGDRRRADLEIQGIRSVFFEHTAWDLALVAQSLAHIDSELAFGLSRIYNAQNTYERLTDGITQAMYLQPPTLNFDAFIASVALYYGDISIMEPKLIEMYDQLIPQIDQALRK